MSFHLYCVYIGSFVVGGLATLFFMYFFFAGSCNDFPSKDLARAFYSVDSERWSHLDGDRDGIPCE